jgi:hypothetical protein
MLWLARDICLMESHPKRELRTRTIPELISSGWSPKPKRVTAAVMSVKRKGPLLLQAAKQAERHENDSGFVD